MAAVIGRAARFAIGLDAGAVTGASASWGLGGVRLRAQARVALPPAALVPSPLEATAEHAGVVAEALRELAARLQTGASPVVLVLPDGVARLAIVEVAPGTDPRPYARFRLAPSLPYPTDEAMVEVLPVSSRRVLAAALRRRVVAGYEALADAAGLRVERIDLAPLLALLSLRGEGPPSGVAVLLGDAAVSLAAHAPDGELAAFRNRRRSRDAGEPRRLLEEALRTAALAGSGVRPRLRAVGPGAAALHAAWEAAGADVAPARLAAEAESAWLAAAFAG
jgi:hypothetical protein